MTRPLSADERNLLKYRHTDPDAWWLHAQTVKNSQTGKLLFPAPEEIMAIQIASAQQVITKNAVAGDTRTKAERDADDAAAFVAKYPEAKAL